MHKEEENNKLGADDVENGKEEIMTNGRRKKYDPWKPFPKDVIIKIPNSSPTFRIPDVDKSIKKMMKDLFGK